MNDLYLTMTIEEVAEAMEWTLGSYHGDIDDYDKESNKYEVAIHYVADDKEEMDIVIELICEALSITVEQYHNSYIYTKDDYAISFYGYTKEEYYN